MRTVQAIHQSVIIPAGRAELSGDLDLPAESAGLVLFAHGSGSSRHSPRNRYVAEVIREAGIGTLLFDLLTQEEEAEDQFTGHLRFDINLLASRLTEAILVSSYSSRSAARSGSSPLSMPPCGSCQGASTSLRSSPLSGLRRPMNTLPSWLNTTTPTQSR